MLVAHIVVLMMHGLTNVKKLGTFVHNSLLGDNKLHENWHSDRHKVLVHTAHLLADLGEIMHIMLLSFCEFREKLCFS